MNRSNHPGARKGSPIEGILAGLRRLLKRDPDLEDPYARVRVPLKKNPGGRSAAVALEEPFD